MSFMPLDGPSTTCLGPVVVETIGSFAILDRCDPWFSNMIWVVRHHRYEGHTFPTLVFDKLECCRQLGLVLRLRVP